MHYLDLVYFHTEQLSIPVATPESLTCVDVYWCTVSKDQVIKCIILSCLHVLDGTVVNEHFSLHLDRTEQLPGRWANERVSGSAASGGPTHEARGCQRLLWD